MYKRKRGDDNHIGCEARHTKVKIQRVLTKAYEAQSYQILRHHQTKEK
jgi:hypothetical protein